MDFSVFCISYIEAGEKGKESFNDVNIVLDMMDLRSSKRPRRGPDLHRFISILSMLLLGRMGSYAISLCLTVY